MTAVFEARCRTSAGSGLDINLLPWPLNALLLLFAA